MSTYLPTIENLVALASILSVPIEEILAAECRTNEVERGERT